MCTNIPQQCSYISYSLVLHLLEEMARFCELEKTNHSLYYRLHFSESAMEGPCSAESSTAAFRTSEN